MPLTISAAVIHCNDLIAPPNRERTQLLGKIVRACLDSDVILLPAGYYEYHSDSLQSVEKNVSSILQRQSSSSVVCVGVDYHKQKDQLAYAISQEGIVSAGRKFYPTAGERDDIASAAGYMSKEAGKGRIFQINGFRCYLAVCYDCFGIRHLNLENPGIDICLDLVHGFLPRGYGSSGDVDFARKGFAGASMQWQCPVLGAGVFFGRNIPENWPAGVMWSGAKSV